LLSINGLGKIIANQKGLENDVSGAEGSSSQLDA